MIIGVPKEIKNSEFRVGLTNVNVQKLSQAGHQVWIQKQAGIGSGITDQAYIQAGAKLADNIQEIYQKSDLIVKVKEPLQEEFSLLKKNQILFTFLHLAAEPQLTTVLCDKQIRAIAYETIENENNELPLLEPMSQIAGRVALQNGIYYLQKFTGGKGLLAGGISGAKPAHVTILGGGTAGLHAAKAALGLEAKVTILEINPQRLKYLSQIFTNKLSLLTSNSKNLISALKTTDLLIGSVLLKGHKAPKLVSKQMIQQLPENSVVIDISIDQGGCIETARVTSHERPIYKQDQVIHYCVPNIPGAVPRTSTYALTNISFPYIQELTNLGFKKSLTQNPYLKKGLNTYQGHITCLPVAQALNKTYKDVAELGL